LITVIFNKGPVRHLAPNNVVGAGSDLTIYSFFLKTNLYEKVLLCFYGSH
jgi:hypothetical protein